MAKEKKANDVLLHTRYDPMEQSAAWYLERADEGRYRKIQLLVSNNNIFQLEMDMQEGDEVFKYYSFYKKQGRFSNFSLRDRK